MHITLKDLHEWGIKNVPIKYQGNIYKLFYNGKNYQLFDSTTNKTINIYKKSKGIYGLETNKTN